jgi:type IV secretory pathway VirB2 component (pilin)
LLINNMRKNIKYIAGSIIPLFITTSVYAAPPKLADIGGILDNVFNLIMPVGGLIAVIMIIYGGYMWIMSGGDAQKTQQAQGTLTWAVLGLVFLFVIRMVLKVVFDFIGT